MLKTSEVRPLVKADKTGDLRPVFLRVKTSFPLRGQVRHRDRDIHWGFRLARRPEANGQSRVQLSAWALSPDARVPASIIGFYSRGKLVHLARPNRQRGDVLRVLGIDADANAPIMTCGFSDEFDTSADHLDIRIALDDDEVSIGSVDLSLREVLAGQDHWLFLSDDSNDSVAQHCVDFRPTAGWLAAWDRYFAALSKLPATKAVFLVAPAKESVMPDRYPVPRCDKTPVARLLERYPGRILYPLEALRQARDLAYDRVDTHWTDLGARIACEQVLTHLGEKLPPVPSLYAIAEGRGDLGDKLVPPEKALRPSAGWPDTSACVFDNFALHHGNIRILSNPHAPLDRKVVIFGGSSSNYMIRYLSASCRRVVSIYSVGSWDPAIIAHEQPDIVILQTNERFLVVPPAPHVDCIARANEKIADGHLTLTTPPDQVPPSFADTGEDWYAARHKPLFPQQSRGNIRTMLKEEQVEAKRNFHAIPHKGEIGIHEQRIAEHFGNACRWNDGDAGIDQGLFVLGFSNRCGSNMLADYLRQTGSFHFMGESLNFDTVLKRSQENGVESFPDYIRYLAEPGRDRPFFGVKASWDQLAMLYRWNIPSMFNQTRVMIIQRRSVVRQAVSLAIATQTRQWSSRQSGTDVTPTFSAKGIAAIITSIERSSAMMLRLCDALGLPYTTLYYEDLLRDPDAVVSAKLGELGIETGALKLSAPSISRQSNQINDDFVARMQRHLLAELGLAEQAD